MTQAMPVTIIGGYLGAGKTTLVNQMLRQANGAKLAILVNEFGSLPIDEDLIEAQDDDLISIAGGCICCSFGSDLAAAMLQLADLPTRPDHLIIESSGVALPRAIAQTIDLLDAFSVEGVIVLADAETIRKQARDEYIGDTILRQVDDADLLVLTKADLVSDESLTETQEWLTSHKAQIVIAEHGKVPNAVVLGRFENDHAGHVGKHHDAAYDSIALRPAAPTDAQILASKLGDDPNIVRAKGYVDDISGAMALIQVVGTRAEVSFPDNTGGVGLICIGLKGHLDHVSM